MAKVPIATRWKKVKKVVSSPMKGKRSPSEWRKDTVSLFFGEERKTGDYHYAYEVETMLDGSAIYLLRPTWKRGMDYLVVYKASDGSFEGPRFEWVEQDLKSKKHGSPEAYGTLHRGMSEVHAGDDPDEVLVRYPQLSRTDWTGLPVENLLKIVKWLFIDEDIKYWGQGGRDTWKQSLDELKK